jgi:ribosomal protein L11 methylase PrmA
VRRLLVLSGIADPMSDKVVTAYQSTGMDVIRRLQRDGWNSMLLGR